MAKVAAALALLGLIAAACAPVRQPGRFQALALAATVGEPGSETATHLRYIAAAQRPSGAIAMHPGSEWINPYFANIAAQALLSQPGQLEPVRRYMEWYVGHLKPDGSIDDHRVEGALELPTSNADSTDSYAATFLSLAAAWVRAGGSLDWIRKQRPALDRVAGAILSVTDGDGLTWAKPEYPYKLLMDNCEVYAGWRDWAWVTERLGDPVASLTAVKLAQRLRSGLAVLRQRDGTWGWGMNSRGLVLESRMSRFYPDAVAQVFPLIFGLSDDQSGYQALDTAHPSWRQLRAANFPWVLPAYASMLSGDPAAALQALAAADRAYSALRWPWHIGESAWLLRTMAALDLD